MFKQGLISWTYLGSRYTINWITTFCTALLVALALLSEKHLAAGYMCLLFAILSAIPMYFTLKVRNAERLESQTKEEYNLWLVRVFSKAINDYRTLILSNYSQSIQSKDDENMRLLEEKIIETFKLLPLKLQTDCLLESLKIIGRPTVCSSDTNSLVFSIRLQMLAFKMFDKLEKL